MNDKMKALVTYGPGDYRLERINIPQIKDTEILVKVEGCGICAGDLKAYDGAERFWGNGETNGYIETPAIPGHEFVGRIVQKGKNSSSRFHIGDRVISEQIVPCNNCIYCNTGRYWLCEKHDVYGFKSYLNGGMAEYIVFPENSINHKVPDELTIEQALLIEPFACSKHAVDRAVISNEHVVVISGAGTLGLGMIGISKMKNPKKLIVLDLMDKRLELALKFGADIVINPLKEDVESRILKLTNGYGCDVYIEATGHPSSVNQGLKVIRKMGTFVEFSVFKDKVTCDWSVIGDEKEITIYGSQLSPYCYLPVIEYMREGMLPYQGVITHKFSIEDWKEAFETARKSDICIKAVIIP